MCNGIDDDCDGTVDEGVDGDGDGFATCGEDCDDADAGVNPGATEICATGVDEDCDGVEGEEGCRYDSDGDGWYADGGDCDDSDADVRPDAVESCDGVDQDCDGVVDDGFDVDLDGYTTCGGDCDDRDPSIHPGRVESCDGVDQDCDGGIDDGFDLDGDGDGWDDLVAGAAHGYMGGGGSGAALLFLGPLGAGELVDTDADATLRIEAVGDAFGDGVACAGDLTGDGHGDLLVTSPYNGSAWLFPGPLAAGAYVGEDDAHRITGSGTDARISPDPGDVNGDGQVDLVLANPFAGTGGTVWLVEGPVTGDLTLTTTWDARLSGSASGDAFGSRLTLGGDLDGDGHDDLVVSAPSSDPGGRTSAGSAYVF